MSVRVQADRGHREPREALARIMLLRLIAHPGGRVLGRT